MPPSVTVAAFAFGMALLLAAIIGKEIKIVAIELPALKGATRVVIGVLGVALVVVGLLDLRPAPSPASQLPTPSPTATDTPAPAATPTSPPAPAASADRALFLSDFTADRGEWPTGQESNDRGVVTRTIAGGNYQWTITATSQGGYQLALPRSAPVPKDFELQIEARALQGDAFYGVIFRNTGRTSYYLFLLRGRDYALYRIDPQGQTMPLSQADSPAIRHDAANQLTVIAAGPSIRLFINETLVGEATDPQPAAGTAGIYVNAPGGVQTTYEFDNFRLSNLAGAD